MTPKLETYHTTTQVADRLHVSVPTVKRWLGAGKLRKVKAGGATLITETALQDFLKQCTESEAA